MLRPSNLTIAVPYFGCNKNCEYCISRMTGNYDNNYIDEKNDFLFMLNFHKVKNIADKGGVNNILVTGKGEPLIGDSFFYTKYSLWEFRDYITEIQTNGRKLQDNGVIHDLIKHKTNVVAISVDDENEISQLRSEIRKLRDVGIIVRLTINLSGMLDSVHFIDKTIFGYDVKPFLHDITKMCVTNGVNQLTFRQLSIPYGDEDTEPAKWIYKFANPKKYNKITKQINKEVMKEGFLLRTMNHGVSIFEYLGLGVSISDYCIQEYHTEDNLRSIIYMQDGHLYTHWGRSASVLM